MPQPPGHPNHGFIRRAHRVFMFMGIVYGALLVLLTVPAVQRQAVFMHNLRFPLVGDYEHPEKSVLAPFKARNVRIHTPDNETIGAWFTVADRFYKSRAGAGPLTDDAITAALQQHPTVLFFHGNAATRVLKRRIAYYQAYSNRLGANVLAIDYRGFGDSTGTPSEEGLEIDARAAWDWLEARGARQEDILVVGNSLGTGVSVQLVSGLKSDGKTPRGLVLLAPFTSTGSLMETYHLFGVFPLLSPLKTLPFAINFIRRFVLHRFDNLSKITALECPILVVHAEDDWDIPFAHSETLFGAFVEPHLPALSVLPGPSWAQSDELSRLHATLEQRTEARGKLVVQKDIEGLGTMETFRRNATDSPVVFLKTKWGGHDVVGLLEGVQDVMGDMFSMSIF
ncbi:alpha/beta-hydrolase [Dentipellis sp. KUC8613]|nr:alpha/beta-hydrolase [Dentipellis sp. KUC8613]